MTMHRMKHEIRRTLLFLGRERAALFSSRTNSQIPKPLFPEELNVIYDSKCNVCKIEMDFLARRDIKLSGSEPRKIRLTDIESEDYNPNDPVNGGVSYEKGMAAIHAVTSDGRIIEGVPVFGRMYELVGLGWLNTISESRGMKPMVEWGYKLFAKYRTNITRGSSLEELVAAKQAIQKEELEECNRCDNNTRR